MGQGRDLGLHPLGHFNCRTLGTENPSQSLTLTWGIMSGTFWGPLHPSGPSALRSC